jgi:hypothetical protein
VKVYHLVTIDSVEEWIMDVQARKKKISDAIVSTENSSVFSMGTDRLLDVFTGRSSSDSSDADDAANKIDSPFVDLDALVDRCADDYKSLSVEEFLRGLRQSVSHDAVN